MSQNTSDATIPLDRTAPPAAPAKPTNPYASAYAGFLAQTEAHVLKVLHEDGLYRHLRIQAPGTRMWSWDPTTWPGHLATSGDVADGLVFARDPDMFEFFGRAGRQNYYSDGAPSIDFGYWAQKLQGRNWGAVAVRVYDAEVFLAQVEEHLRQHDELGDDAQDDRRKQALLLDKLYKIRGLDRAALIENLKKHCAATDAVEADDARLRASRAAIVSRGHHQRAQAAADSLRELWSTDGLTDEQFETLALVGLE